jgi:chromosome partitioning protein
VTEQRVARLQGGKPASLISGVVLAVVNAKGGTTKTTTAVNLAAGLALRGHRTLLVDLDQQASASLSLGLSRATLPFGAAAVLLDGLDIRQARLGTDTPGLELVAGEFELANADVRLAGERDRAERLRRALEPIRGDYAFVVLDCPPSLGLVTVNALVAADRYLVPVVPEYLALEGVAGLLEAVERLRLGMGDVADMLGLLLTRVSYRTRSATEIVEGLRRHYGRRVLETEIPVNVRLAEAPSYGLTVYGHAPSSTGARAYGRLTDEVLTRLRKDGFTASKKGGKQS